MLISQFLIRKIRRISIWRIFIIKIPIILLFTYYKEYCISHNRTVDILCRWTKFACI